MRRIEWRFDATTSTLHRGLAALLFASFGGVSLLLTYTLSLVVLGSVAGVAERPFSVVVGLVVAVAYWLGLDGQLDGLWPFRDYSVHLLLVASVVGVVGLAAAATVSFDALVGSFLVVFVPSALLHGTCRSAGSVDLDTGLVEVNGRRTTVSDVESVRTVSCGVATVVRFELTTDADAPLSTPFVVRPGTARALRQLLEPDAG
ncbi:hypothetical protein [Haloarchaeobius iranensis]|uniref:Uncharacterized protein n=1 Tax=Haloarchaeobius iranensis TaxID=996166 RepID=A0A1G9UE54_9EURY|nr:hypothetical protein [Haloarchaeobius iranensis]SDM58004.1 hypothetical protein SAMN05192554_10474 [Haloarchaeobius iranensis]